MLFLSVLPSVLSWLTLACSGLYPSWLFLSLSRALEEPLSQVVGFAVPDLPNACSFLLVEMGLSILQPSAQASPSSDPLCFKISESQWKTNGKCRCYWEHKGPPPQHHCLN